MYIVVIISFFELVSADILLETKSGPVQGVNARFANDVEAFLGIPYAEPPIGDLRFAKPIPKKNWTNTIISSTLPPPCVQFSPDIPSYFLPDTTNMSEDCLFLNIWVPTSKYNYGLRPIIIFIYGGAFSTGATNMYDGSKLASRGNLIYVTVNFRVGALGYFLAHTEEAPGNMGMYDQVMAMKWIKDNAEIFGGDPENISLMGESAGAFSISAHMVSPLSKKLFKRVILESGSIMHPFFNDNNVRLFKNSQTVASILGCTNKTVSLGSDPHSVVNCLKHKPKEDIVQAEERISKSNPITFFPRVNDEFLPKSPAELYREGKFRKDIDVLLGVNRDEGTIMLIFGMPDYFGHYGIDNSQSLNEKHARLIILGAIMYLKQSNASEISDFYLKRVKNRTSLGYTKMVAETVGDFVISCSTIFQADFMSLKGNPVYFYQFGFRPASIPTADWVGVSHFDELQYVFGIPMFDNFTAEEVEFSNNCVDRWAAFARTGNPNIPDHMPWLRYSHHNPVYLDLGQEEESMRMNPLDHRCEIWRKRFNADIDATMIRYLRNSGMNATN